MTTPPTISDVLSRAADLIEDDGFNCSFSSLQRTLREVIGKQGEVNIEDILSFLRSFLNVSSLSWWLQDTATSEVVAKLREASSKAKERGL